MELTTLRIGYGQESSGLMGDVFISLITKQADTSCFVYDRANYRPYD